MRRVATLYRTTVGKKVLMAVSGVVLFGFVFVHMVGNLKMLFPPDASGRYAMDVYAEYLRERPNDQTAQNFQILLLGDLGAIDELRAAIEEFERRDGYDLVVNNDSITASMSMSAESSDTVVSPGLRATTDTMIDPRTVCRSMSTDRSACRCRISTWRSRTVCLLPDGK